MGSTRQPDGLKVGTGNPLLQQVQAVVAPLGTAHTNSSSNHSSSSSSRPEETFPEYNRHLAWALEQDLAGVVGTRALYVAGGWGGWLSWGRFSMLGEMHSLLPRRYKKNLKGLVVLQHTPVLHSFFEFANLFLSPKFYRKLEFCDGVAELASKFPSEIIEVQGDETWTPPPLPPPPLQSAPRPASPLLRNGGTKGAAIKERSRRGSLDKNFSTSSAAASGTTMTTDPNTPSPVAAAPCTASSASRVTILGNTTPASGNIDAGTAVKIRKTRSGSSSSSGGTSSLPSASEAAAAALLAGGGGNAGRGVITTAAELFCDSPCWALEASALATPTQRERSYSSFGGRAFASVPVGGNTIIENHGISPSGSTGSFSAMRSQRTLGSAPTHFSYRRGSSTSGCWERGKGGGASGRNGGVSPTTPKGGTRHHRRSGFSTTTSTSSSLSSFSAAAAMAVPGERASPRPSPSPRGRGVITPRGTSGQRSSWGGSPCSGGGWRSGPTTPRQNGTTTVSFVAPSPGTPARKGPGWQARGGSSPLSKGHRHVTQEQQFSSCPGGGKAGGGSTAAAACNAIAKTAAGSGWVRPGFQLAAVASEATAAERSEGRGKVAASRKTKDHQHHHKYPKSPKMKNDGRAADTETTGSSLAGPGQGIDRRKRHLHTFNSGTRRSSSSQHDQHHREQHPKSPLSRPWSSSSIPSPNQLAALEREVEICSARVARTAGYVRFSVAAKAGGSGGGSGSGSRSGSSVFAAVDEDEEEMDFPPSPPSSGSTACGCASDGGGGADAAGRATDRDAKKTRTTDMPTTHNVNVNGNVNGNGNGNREVVAGGKSGAATGRATDKNGSAPADHPAPLRRAATGKTVAAAKSAWEKAGEGSAAAAGGVKSRGAGKVAQHLSTLARISPGIQALMANYDAAARPVTPGMKTPLSTTPAKPAGSAAPSKTAACGGGGSGGRGATSAGAASPDDREVFPAGAAKDAATPTPAVPQATSVFASTPAGGAMRDISVGVAGFASVFKSFEGRGAAAPVRTTPRSQQQQQQRRSKHRNDAGEIRCAMRGHRLSLKHALDAEAAAAAAGSAAKGQEVSVDRARDGRSRAGSSVQRRRSLSACSKDKVFGVPLIGLMQQGEQVPWVVKRFVDFLSKFGLESVGLFRLAGDGMDCADLRDALDNGKQVCWDPIDPIDEAEGSTGATDCASSSLMDVNMVAQLLKAFFRELPEPLVPFSAYSKVIAIAKAAGVADARWVQAMKSILWGIPIANYNCLRFLFEFLREVAMHSSTNRMTSENLAIVWAPNLLRPQDDDPFAVLRDLRFQIETVRWMVDCCDQLFDD
ncbi:similar to Rho GTPase activating protein 24 [Ectocarpus siliculosus]|uniref:Similar to Rho GTPase activating protein 24 n=1 Tax=Ectocarpus siliculosus TaxID=2880 RepID=D7FL35_ECTSI|nr:similar to Rho GTPase activating protein 24 [Ectocarpus siliculosus]|eukprot:CBJ29572.1 similar to Rho GTPase activating protein 24 [Ectocarpus siliculosus]